MDLVDIKVILF